MKRTLGVFALVAAIASGAFVLEEAVRTLIALDRVERDRGAWQRADEVVRQLNLHPGDTVVDLGAGAGYFAVKIAPAVAPRGRVLAVDLRRQSLAFLWIRSRLRSEWNVRIILGRVDAPGLPAGPIDAALIANTHHELAAPAPILVVLFTSMRQGGRLVVVDRGPRGDSEAGGGGHHAIPPGVDEREITRAGFQTIVREDRFIDRAEDQDLWWLLVFRKY